MITATQLINQLRTYTPADAQERESVQKIIQWLQTNPVLTYPENKTGHLTADCWLLSPDYSQVLLTLHHKFQRWIQVGGHVDAGESLTQAGVREAREESGIENIRLLSPNIFDLDVHWVDSYPGEEHYHYDIRFLAQASSWNYVISPESDDLRWFTPAQVEALVATGTNQINATLGRMTQKWRDFLAKM
ncbi:NUDIX hydrolase [bacterium]|nr:NUDIX hydrolase [bacterium]